jgi:hypothetical protein
LFLKKRELSIIDFINNIERINNAGNDERAIKSQTETKGMKGITNNVVAAIIN